MMLLNDLQIDENIRTALRDADSKEKLGVVAAVTGISGGEDKLRSIMNSARPILDMDRATLGMHLS